MSAVYDAKISSTIPNYDMLHFSAIDLIRSSGRPAARWLDTGCGTGTLCVKAKDLFPETEFVLSDPSVEMLNIAKEKIGANKKVSYGQADTQNIVIPNEYFDVITAIQCHHYLDQAERIRATQNCYRMLKRNGIYVEFENIRPLSEEGIWIGLKRWEKYQIDNGKQAQEASDHIKRFDTEYFPITITDHIRMLENAGFSTVEVLWASYMQAGFYAIK